MAIQRYKAVDSDGENALCMRCDTGDLVDYADHVAEVALKDQEIARLRTFLLRIASIPDDKYSRHDKWVRGLGIEARKLLADYKEVQS